LANPSTTFGIEVSAEAKQLLISGIQFFAVSLIRDFAIIALAFTEVFHEFPIPRSEQAGYFAHSRDSLELGAVAGAAGARSAPVDANYQ
jgi:hypothetical protein